MVKVIDCSHPKCPVLVGAPKGEFFIRLQLGFFKRKEYRWDDVSMLSEIDSETYRNAGKAAVGALVGGVLTGGIGLLAGAVIGGAQEKGSLVLPKAERREPSRLLDH